MRRLFVTDEAVCCHANDAPFDAHLREAQAHLFKCYVATGPSTSEACARAKALHLTARRDSRLETASGSMGPSLTRMDVALQLAAVRVQLIHLCGQAGPSLNTARRIVLAERSIGRTAVAYCSPAGSSLQMAHGVCQSVAVLNGRRRPRWPLDQRVLDRQDDAST